MFSKNSTNQKVVHSCFNENISKYDYLFMSVPEASWRLYNSKNDIQDYEIFKIPFITLSDRIFVKIRNLTYRYMPNQLTLFPTENNMICGFSMNL